MNHPFTENPPHSSRQPFGRVLDLEALAHFCHPARGMPGPCIIDGMATACNGYIALQADDIGPDTLPHATEKHARDFLEHYPWHLFADAANPNDWKPLDDYSLALWKFGPKPFWERSTKTYWPRMASIGVGHGRTFTGGLHLVARLPRAEVHTGTAAPPTTLLFRFKHGKGLIVAPHNLPHASFNLIPPPPRDRYP